MRVSQFVLAGVLSGLCACGGDSTAAPPIQTPAQSVVTTVTVSASPTSIVAGSTTTATVKVFDQNNAAITGKTVTWASDDVAIATVTSAGVITGVAPGTTNIGATVDGRQGHVAITVTRSTAWTVDATILTNADYGGAVGSLADVAVLKLNDGRYRMFIGGIPTSPGIGSAISSDGVHFTPESGLRLSADISTTLAQHVIVSHPGVVRLDDGRVRLFAHNAPGAPAVMSMFSFTSSDEGLTFTVDSGARFNINDASAVNLTGAAIVKVKTGGWRMYFTSTTPPTLNSAGVITKFGVGSIHSAFSTDLFTWTQDPGIRIGPGSAVTGSATHPGAIANDDGSVTLVYFREDDAKLYTATSADGLTFPAESFAGFGPNLPLGIAADPCLVRMANGDVRMYYNWGDDKTGAIYTAHRAPFTLGGQ